MAALDPAALEQELASLRRQRFEASQRVRASRLPAVGQPPQRGVGLGDPAGARAPLGSSRDFGPPERGFGGPSSARGDGPRGARDGPLFGRLGSIPSPRGPEGRDSGRSTRPYGNDLGNGSYGRDLDRDRDGPAADGRGPAPAPARRRAVQSVVVGARDSRPDEEARVEAREEPRKDHHREQDGERRDGRWRDEEGYGRARGADADEDGSRRGDSRHHPQHRPEDDNDNGDDRPSGRGAKRPAPEPAAPPAGATDPDSRKRARRLLGRALLGTLQKFRQEDAQFQASEAATRRAELARKAEEKAAAESERLRRQAADERARKRQEELSALMDLNLATDIKVLELLYAKKLARRRALAAFLRADGLPSSSKGGQALAAASAGPRPVYWLPVKHCKETLAIKERQERELRAWEESVLAELEQEKEGLRMRAQGRREALAERRQRAAADREAGGQAAGPAGAEEEAEDHEALEAVELDAHHEDPGPEMEAEVEVEAEEEGDLEAGGRAGDAAEGADDARKNVEARPSDADEATGKGAGADEIEAHRDDLDAPADEPMDG